MKEVSYIIGNKDYIKFSEYIKRLIDKEAMKGKMVKQKLADISSQISNGDAVIALNGQTLVGYICLEHWEHYIEVGALIVEETHRRAGIGIKLVKHVLSLARTKYPGKKIIALANNVSSLIFEMIGFEYKGKDEFNNEVWSLCSACVSYNDFPDCHCRPMIYKEKKLDISLLSEDDIDTCKHIAEMYCDVWKEKPWLELFWKPEHVMKSLAKQFQRKFSVLAIATYNDELIGFCWGNQIRKKEMRKFSKHHLLDGLFKADKNIFLVKEIAIKPGCRSKGIGRKLLLAVMRIGVEYGINTWILRTNKYAKPAQKMYQNVGFERINISDNKFTNREFWLFS